MTNESPWRIVRNETDEKGHTVEMRYAEFGKGRSKIRKWELYRDGQRAGYAVNAPDAEANFARVMSGYVLNPRSGFYEKAEEKTDG